MTETKNQQPVVIPPAKAKRGTHLEKYQKRFQPGQSGNPGGRAKTAPISKALRAICDEIDQNTGLDGAQRAARALFKEVLKGNVWAFSKMVELVEGRISAAIAVEIGDSETAISSAKQKLMQKLIRVEAENAAGSVSVTISQKRLPFRPMRQLFQVGEGEHSETQRS